MINIRALRDKAALREAAPSILLVVNTFVWYIATYAVFNTIVNNLHVLETEKLGLFAIYFVGIAVTAIPGSKFFVRARIKSLDLWLFMGALATLFLAAFSSDSVLADAFFAFFFGASIGIGLPSCLSYFADSTSVENRGFVGGVIWSTVGITVLIFAFLISNLGQWEAIIVLTIWRLLGGICFSVLNRNQTKPAAQKTPSYSELIRKREILLYLFPWVMFSIINFAEAPVLEGVFGANFAFMQFAEFALIGIFAIVGGIIADFTGRKRVVIAGFVMLGIEYAALSAFSTSQAAFYLFLILDGITWGLLVSVFFMAIWGDLGENREKEKYYTLGGLPYILAAFLSVLIKPYASKIPPTTAFTFASFFLFLAVIPLMYAPETFPEKAMKDRDLKSYTEKALKKVQKEAEKSQKKHSDKAENEKGKEESEETPEDAEARKLVEKYY
jgi:MFS family permease